ncbi:MAG: hypothetical protein R2831_06855 [Chitinophagaceae bacterium]
MANLKTFLGELVTNISKARVESDIQSISIAKEYAKDELLKHLSIPRMKVDSVEISIPLGITEVKYKESEIFEPIDNKKMTSVTYQNILKSIQLEKMPLEYSKAYISTIQSQIQILESHVKANQKERASLIFLDSISSKIGQEINAIYKSSKKQPLNLEQIKLIQDNLKEQLQKEVIDAIKVENKEKKVDEIDVIIESSKLQEVKPENLIVVKMKISEQGLEWVNYENLNGEEKSKLIPE